MGPNRSKTQRWRSTLKQLCERQGTIEISIEGSGDDAMLRDLVWRVRLIRVADEHLVIAAPAAARRTVQLEPGCPLVAAMAVGQNRWMFHTRVLDDPALRDGRPPVLGLEMPTTVERCLRRAFFRISTVELKLPSVRLWPLHERASAVPVEIASRHTEESPHLIQPDMGQEFEGTLLNIGGGGLGLLVPSQHAARLRQKSLIWINLDLGDGLPLLLMTGRLSHVRLDSNGDLHSGVVFDFSMDPAHEAFIGERICAYAGSLQRRDSQNTAA
ncbi:MAG: PilZ domain-containing protein [Planctomycetota bacterium]